MTDQTTDRIPLRPIPTREDRMAAATAETTDPHATCHDRDTCADRTREVVNALTGQRDRAAASHRQALEARDVLRAERDQAYAELNHVSAALDRAGINGPGSLGDRIDAAAEALARTRAGAHALEAERDDLRIALGRADAETAAMVRDRDEVIRERDQARHERDTLTDAIARMISLPPDAVAHAYNVRYGPAERPNSPAGHPSGGDDATEAHRGAQRAHEPNCHADPRAHWTDCECWCHDHAANEEQEHVCDPIECACELSPTDAPPPGSGGDRAQAIRPADWERKAVAAARDALAAAWPNLGAGAVAEVSVRAIIDAGLAGPGGRCPACGSTYPRTPDPADPRCWTCSSEPDPAEIAEHRPGVTALLAQIRHEAAEVQAAALADPDGDHMGPAYPANTHDHSTGYPLFAPDAELIVGTSDGPQPWTGTEWNEHVRWAARARGGVTERLVTCPTSVCTTACPANPDRIDL